MSVPSAPEERHSFLDSCLVEGDSAQELRVRRNKRRALLVSIVVQILIVAALVLFPLLSKGENIAGRVLIFPTVPYSPGGGPSHPRNPQRPRRDNSNVCRFCPPLSIPSTIDRHGPDTARNTENPGDDFPVIPGVLPGSNVPGGLTPTSAQRQPPPPDPDPTPTTKPRRISEPVQAAMLIRRIEPLYPHIAIQLHREGRVELHALIATDGTIQSLEVVSGDPLFIRSALDAVREWRYRPTILNGQPVEVDTHITVVYTLSH
jgi:protein TonB